VAASWVSALALCYIAYLGNTPGSGVKYAWQLRRHWWAPLAPPTVVSLNSIVTALAILGCRRPVPSPSQQQCGCRCWRGCRWYHHDGGLTLWSALGVAKFADLLVQACWGAVGRHYYYIALLVVSNWGVFVLMAYLILLETERAAGPLGDDETFGGGAPGSRSYAATGQSSEALQVSFWGRMMTCVPVAGRYMQHASRQQKLHGTLGV
jgi:hypothetical protein